MHGDAVKARPGREKTKMVVPPKVLTRPFRRWWFNSSYWLFSRCFHAPSPNTTERSQSINGHQSRKRNFGRQSSISCAWKKGKDRQNACRKNPDRVCLKGQLNTRCNGWRNKKTGLFHRHPFERKSLPIKAKGRQSRSTGFARVLVWIVAGTKPSGRTLDLYIYIYIANDESPSQHVTVGLAEARPNYAECWKKSVVACPPPQFQKESEKEARFLANPLS